MLNLTFGIEIECILTDDILEPDSHQGKPFPRMGEKLLKLSPGWTVKTDSSLKSNQQIKTNRGFDLTSAEYRQPAYPIEIVSPPLTGYAGLAEIKRMLTFLRQYGYTNDSCGGHVHIGVCSLFGANYVSDISAPILAQFAQNVTLMVAALEDGIVSYSGGFSRKNNDNYCRQAKQAIKNIRTEKYSVLDGQGRPNNRYRAINLVSIAHHGTVEFRLFAGSLDSDQWLTNIMVAAKIAQMARDNAPIPKFIRKLSGQNMLKVFTLVFGKTLPTFVKRIEPHADCYKPQPEDHRKQKSPPDRSGTLPENRRFGYRDRSLDPYRPSTTQDRPTRRPLRRFGESDESFDRRFQEWESHQ